MIHGPDVSALKEQAKSAVMRHFVAVAESDDVSPTLRAMYVLKALMAREVLKGGTSDYIEAEAKKRGVTPLQMAQVIDDLAKHSEAVELKRMDANVDIDAATDAHGVMAVLDNIGVSLYPAPLVI